MVGQPPTPRTSATASARRSRTRVATDLAADDEARIWSTAATEEIGSMNTEIGPRTARAGIERDSADRRGGAEPREQRRHDRDGSGSDAPQRTQLNGTKNARGASRGIVASRERAPDRDGPDEHRTGAHRDRSRRTRRRIATQTSTLSASTRTAAAADFEEAQTGAHERTDRRNTVGLNVGTGGRTRRPTGAHLDGAADGSGAAANAADVGTDRPAPRAPGATARGR